MQHINPRAQIAAKQRVLEDNLQRIGQVKPEVILRPIAGPTWGYRYRARLSVRNVHKKGEVLVGFREKNGSYVANMTACEVLPKHISDLLPKLRELIGLTSIADHIPQIEVAVGQENSVMACTCGCSHKVWTVCNPFIPRTARCFMICPSLAFACRIVRPILLK